MFSTHLLILAAFLWLLPPESHLSGSEVPKTRQSPPAEEGLTAKQGTQIVLWINYNTPVYTY